MEDNKRIYETKAIHYISITRSKYTRPLDKLKKQCTDQNRSSLEFCIWFDYSLVKVAKLSQTVFNCILDLIESGHISNNYYMKNFRLACVIMQIFVESDQSSNLIKIEDFLQEYPQYKNNTILTPEEPLDFVKLFDYDRVLANKRMFPYFHKEKVSKELIAELISRSLLAFDTKFHNLIYICKFDKEFFGIEKHGIGEKHYLKLKYKEKPVAFMYHSERFKFTNFEQPISKLVFFDNTLNMLKYLSYNIVFPNVLYCSLHTSNCDIDTYTNTLALFDDVETEFCFLEEDKIERFDSAYVSVENKEDTEEDEGDGLPF